MSQNIPQSNSKQKHSLFVLLPLQLLWLAFFCLLFVATTQPAALFQKRSNLFQVISFWVSAHGITNIQIDRQVQWFGWHHLHYGLKLPLDTFDELTTPTYNNCTTALKTKSAILKCILEERKKVVVAVVVSLYTYVTLDLQFGAFWRL